MIKTLLLLALPVSFCASAQLEINNYDQLLLGSKSVDILKIQKALNAKSAAMESDVLNRLNTSSAFVAMRPAVESAENMSAKVPEKEKVQKGVEDVAGKYILHTHRR